MINYNSINKQLILKTKIMKKISQLIILSFLVLLISCKEDKKANNVDGEKAEEVKKEENKFNPVKDGDKKKYVNVRLESKSDSKAYGKLYFVEVDGVVTLEAKFIDLDPGTHAIHIHEKADCSSPDGKSAGGHWNPTFENHGKWGDENGFHKGDIGNIEADENGSAKLKMQTDEWCIGCGDETKDILGKSIIVHQGTDDFVSQPSGNAGARISCGGIIE
jgi:Cu-Zn family superoxide dismutase